MNKVPLEDRPRPKDEIETSKGKFKKALKIIGASAFVIALICGGLVIVHNSYYTTFFVNGQSMYPTLNKNAKSSNGEIVGEYGGNSNLNYVVDFGIMDTSSKRLNSLKRGDIVISFYSTDFDQHGILLPSATTKIKRIAGLPGEKIAINPNGDLLINDAVTELKGTHIYNRTAEGNRGYVYGLLNEDEYFLLGDNRDNSQDSRSKGPVKSTYIVGIAVAIEGTCRISENNNGGYTCVKKHYKFPRWL